MDFRRYRRLNEANISLVLISSRRLRDDHLDTLESKNDLAVFFKEKVIMIKQHHCSFNHSKSIPKMVTFLYLPDSWLVAQCYPSVLLSLSNSHAPRSGSCERSSRCGYPRLLIGNHGQYNVRWMFCVVIDDVMGYLHPGTGRDGIPRI